MESAEGVAADLVDRIGAAVLVRPLFFSFVTLP